MQKVDLMGLFRMTSPRDLIERRLSQIKRQRDIAIARQHGDPEKLPETVYDRQIAAWEIVLETFDKGVEAQRPRTHRIDFSEFKPDRTNLLPDEAQAWLMVQQRLYDAGFDLCRVVRQDPEPGNPMVMIYVQDRA